jgi:hypothetical protein
MKNVFTTIAIFIFLLYSVVFSQKSNCETIIRPSNVKFTDTGIASRLLDEKDGFFGEMELKYAPYPLTFVAVAFSDESSFLSKEFTIDCGEVRRIKISPPPNTSLLTFVFIQRSNLSLFVNKKRDLLELATASRSWVFPFRRVLSATRALPTLSDFQHRDLYPYAFNFISSQSEKTPRYLYNLSTNRKFLFSIHIQEDDGIISRPFGITCLLNGVQFSAFNGKPFIYVKKLPNKSITINAITPSLKRGDYNLNCIGVDSLTNPTSDVGADSIQIQTIFIRVK